MYTCVGSANHDLPVSKAAGIAVLSRGSVDKDALDLPHHARRQWPVPDPGEAMLCRHDIVQVFAEFEGKRLAFLHLRDQDVLERRVRTFKRACALRFPPQGWAPKKSGFRKLPRRFIEPRKCGLGLDNSRPCCGRKVDVGRQFVWEVRPVFVFFASTLIKASDRHNYANGRLAYEIDIQGDPSLQA